MWTAISLALIALIAVSLALIVWKIWAPARKRRQFSIDSALGKIQEVGELCVLKAHVKEVVTVTLSTLLFTRAKMLAICNFEIEFRYNLRKTRIENKEGSGSFRLVLPPYNCEVIPRKLEFYHEQRARFLGLLTFDFSLEERNSLIEQAREKATEQAQLLYESIEGQVQASAKTTLNAIATAFGAESVEFEFAKPETVKEEIRNGMKSLAA
ncbi:MAG: DUF4230 domain-containing protein [Planctomycetia bacterium]|nr:DUF4230 domain-containing protein [Planctomycetia bacterium]